MTDPLAARYEAAPGVLLTDLSETESCLLNTQTLYYYALNETGRTIWNEIAAGRTEGEAAEVLLDVYDVGADDARGHVRSFLKRLLDDDLIVRHESD